MGYCNYFKGPCKTLVACTTGAIIPPCSKTDCLKNCLLGITKDGKVCSDWVCYFLAEQGPEPWSDNNAG